MKIWALARQRPLLENIGKIAFVVVSGEDLRGQDRVKRERERNEPDTYPVFSSRNLINFETVPVI